MSHEEEPQSVMCMTQREWDDIAHVCEGYLYATRWATESPHLYPKETRRRQLCERIVEANK